MAGPEFFSPITPGSPKREIFGRKILLVEGWDECWFFDHLFSMRKLNSEIYQIVEFNGKPNFQTNLELVLSQDKFLDEEVLALGIVLDADQSLAKSKYDLESVVKKVGLGSISLGKFIESDNSTNMYIGGYIMPNNSDIGALESLLMKTVAEHPSAISALSYVTEHGPANLKDFDKRTSQVYLSAQKNLSRGAGIGARSGFFDLEADCLLELNGFIDKFISV